MKKRNVALWVYFAFLIMPIYWMLNTSFKTNNEILNYMHWFPHNFTVKNYVTIFTSPFWRRGFLNSLAFVSLNVVIVIVAAVPAAYAFSRWHFRGDKHLFFWLLTNRMAPTAAFIVPFFALYSNIGLFDTHIAVALAHALFNLPLAIWILEGFMSGIPKEIDETAFVDGYSFPHFFWKIFRPLISQGIAVAAFFAFLFSWVELLLARTLTSTAAKPITVTLSRSLGAGGWDWGALAAAGVLTMIPGALVVYFIRNLMAKGFAMGRV
ncbi:carbohydrate ABC transporter permease [Candidatus Bipolaricaulota bacterium]|nr:carbohydrate ABC transporter permease [Candidatus Bipolaricaulota bacterium]